MCVCLSHAPNPGPGPGVCSDWEWNRQPFGLQAVTQSTEPHQPGQKRGIETCNCVVCIRWSLIYIKGDNSLVQLLPISELSNIGLPPSLPPSLPPFLPSSLPSFLGGKIQFLWTGTLSLFIDMYCLHN